MRASAGGADKHGGLAGPGVNKECRWRIGRGQAAQRIFSALCRRNRDVRGAWPVASPEGGIRVRKAGGELRCSHAHAARSAAPPLQGIEPWNKGRTLSEETRLKMRQAKLNRTASKATRAKMSASHTGKEHSQVRCAALRRGLHACRPPVPCSVWPRLRRRSASGWCSSMCTQLWAGQPVTAPFA